MKTTFLLGLCMATAITASADFSPVTIDGIVYNRIYQGYCEATSATTAGENATVLRSVTFHDGSTDETCLVCRIAKDAFRGTGVKTVKVSESDVSAPFISIFPGAFADCPQLYYVYLPADVSLVDVTAFNNCPSLTSILCKATDVPMARYENLNTTVYTPHTNVTLYVPDSSVELYTGNETDPSDPFWSSFKVRPLSTFTEPDLPGPTPDEPVADEYADADGLVLRLTNGNVKLLDAEAGQRVYITAENGYRLSKLWLDGTDVTADVRDNVYTLPAFSGKIVLNPVFVSTSDAGVLSADAPYVTVRIKGNNIEILGLKPSERISVYNHAGVAVYEGSSRSITLPSGVYILKAGARSFKFAL